MVLVILTTDKNWWTNESWSQEEVEVGALDVSEKYSNISPVYHIFKVNLIPIIFEPMPIEFYFVEASVYHITYGKTLSPG
jgi:hypothetical protein